MTGPLVSVIIPTYQRAHTLRRAVEGALSQTYSPLEVIISDNASTDGTETILSDFAEHDRVRILRQKRNIGPIDNWRAALSAAQGDLVKVNWSDDWMEPHVIDALVSALGSARRATFSVIGQTIHLPHKRFHSRPRAGLISLADVAGSLALELGGLPVSPGAALVERADAEWALDVGTLELRQGCAAKAIGPDFLMLYGSLRRGGFGVHVRGHGVHFEGGADSITMTESFESLMGCYHDAVRVLIEAANDSSHRAALDQMLAISRWINRVRRRPAPRWVPSADCTMLEHARGAWISQRQFAKRIGLSLAVRIESLGGK